MVGDKCSAPALMLSGVPWGTVLDSLGSWFLEYIHNNNDIGIYLFVDDRTVYRTIYNRTTIAKRSWQLSVMREHGIHSKSANSWITKTTYITFNYMSAADSVI